MSTSDVCPAAEALVEVVLGEASLGVGPYVAAHVEGCGRCSAKVRELRATFDMIGTAVGAKPSPAFRARLDASVQRLERFAPHAGAASTLLDVEPEHARRILQDFYDASFKQPLPGVHIRRVPVGPRRAGAFAVLARLEPGASLPRHRHLGDEATLVLEGRLDDGQHGAGPGEVLSAAEGTTHGVRAVGDAECCCVVVAQGGVAWA